MDGMLLVALAVAIAVVLLILAVVAALVLGRVTARGEEAARMESLRREVHRADAAMRPRSMSTGAQ